MAITNWWSSVWTKRGLFGTDFKKQQVYVCSRTIHATVSLTGSESQPLHALPMFCIRLPPSVGIRWGIVCPAACSLFVFVLTGISSGGVSTWAKLADVEVIMTLKVLLSLARGVFPDLMCSVSWIRRTTSAWESEHTVCVDGDGKMERWCEPFDKSLTSSRRDDPDTPKHTDSHSDRFLSLIVLLLFLPTCNCLLCQCLFMLSSQLISLTKRKETLESVQFLFNSSPALFIRAQSQALHFQDVQTLRANFLEHWKQVELSHHTALSNSI